MDFANKLQELRRNKRITQEQLAQALFVSRAAVSKWESGRGYPNIESLKYIARFYGVTVDSLLSADEVTELAQTEQRRNSEHAVRLVFGLTDLCAALLFFLPIFGEERDGGISALSLFQLTAVSDLLKIIYIVCISLTVLCGILSLLPIRRPGKVYCCLSYAVHISGAMTFIISRQVYAALLSLFMLAVKCIFQLKRK